MKSAWVTNINSVEKGFLIKEKISGDMLYDFLESVNTDFPIPLSQKISLREYAEKIIEFGEIVVALEKNTLKGLAIGYTENLKGNSAYISVVGVKKEFRGSGIGKKVVQKFIEICRQKKIKSVNLYTHKSNKAAIKMYKALGFKENSLSEEERIHDIHFILQL